MFAWQSTSEEAGRYCECSPPSTSALSPEYSREIEGDTRRLYFDWIPGAIVYRYRIASGRQEVGTMLFRNGAAISFHRVIDGKVNKNISLYYAHSPSVGIASSHFELATLAGNMPNDSGHMIAAGALNCQWLALAFTVKYRAVERISPQYWEVVVKPMKFSFHSVGVLFSIRALISRGHIDYISRRSLSATFSRRILHSFAERRLSRHAFLGKRDMMEALVSGRRASYRTISSADYRRRIPAGCFETRR